MPLDVPLTTLDGVLMVIAPNPGAVTYFKLFRLESPFVFLDRRPPNLSVDAVLIDNFKGARMCVTHLLLMGHRRIGALMGPAGLQNAHDRDAGYRTALTEAGIPWSLRAGALASAARQYSSRLIAVGVLRQAN